MDEAACDIEIGWSGQALPFFTLEAVGLEFLQLFAGAEVFAAVACVAATEVFESAAGVDEIADG